MPASHRQPVTCPPVPGSRRISTELGLWDTTGERFWIYASKTPALPEGGASGEELARRIWSDDLAAPKGGRPPLWMIELAEQVGMIEPGALLPTGLIVGSAVIERVTRIMHAGGGMYRWHLAEVERARRLRRPRGHPQPMWFKPF